MSKVELYIAIALFLLGLGVAGVLALLGNTLPAIIIFSLCILGGFIFAVLAYKNRINIIDVVTEIHDIRTMYVENQLKVNPINTENMNNQYKELLGIDSSNDVNMILSCVGISEKLQNKKIDNTILQVWSVNVGRLMDRYEKGVDTLTKEDKRYKELMPIYEKWSKHNGNKSKRMAIYNYLLESYGMNSQWLFVGSVMRNNWDDITQLLPEYTITMMDGYKGYMTEYLKKWLDEYNRLSCKKPKKVKGVQNEL